MPCYEPWDEYLEPGTPEHAEAEARVKTLAERTRHMIGAYLQMVGFEPPDGELNLPSPGRPDYDLAPFDPATLRPDLVHRLAQHCVCDQVAFTDLYDVRSMWDREDSADRPYYVVTQCVAWAMRYGAARGGFDEDEYLEAGWEHALRSALQSGS